MTVLEKKAASGVDTKNLGGYVGVALVAGTIGVLGVLGVTRISDNTEITPTQIASLRSAELADYLENQWIAQVNSTKAGDLVEFYRAPFMARVAEIHAQRAADMAGFFSAQNAARVAAINEQRAQDMVDHRYGWQAGFDS